MSTLNVTIIQTDLYWHDATANRAALGKLIAGVAGKTDLIVLPEMFTTGFSMDAPALAEPMDGPSADWLQAQARAADACICGSLIVREGDRFYNRFLAISPEGVRAVYDKRHLFRLADEHSHYAAGRERVLFDVKGFRVCPLICYDLRFPVWSRNRGDYDLLLYVANWPNRRHRAWETLLRARAIENLCYVAGVNRVGTDGNELPYAGGSAVIDYLGQDLADLGDTPGIATASLDLGQLEAFRSRFAFHEDADRFELTD